MFANILLDKAGCMIKPISKGLMRGTVKEVDTGRGGVLEIIMQSNAITMIAFHKKKTKQNKNLDSVTCIGLLCCMFNLIRREDAFSLES